MAVEPRRLDFNEFATNLNVVFDRLKREGRPLIVDREGELYRVQPEAPGPQDLWRHYNADRVRQALRASAGALRGVNRDELLADIHAERAQDSRGRPGD